MLPKLKKVNRAWLMKTEPSVFSYDDLTKSKDKTTCWEGVRNYQARNFMRDEMKVGDLVLVYHSRLDEPGVAGIAEVVKEAYPDKFAFEEKSKYFDAKAKKRGVNPWVMVDVKAKWKAKDLVTLAMMRKESKLKNMRVLKKGMRLSIQPVTEIEFNTVCKMAGG